MQSCGGADAKGEFAELLIFIYIVMYFFERVIPRSNFTIIRKSYPAPTPFLSPQTTAVNIFFSSFEDILGT